MSKTNAMTYQEMIDKINNKERFDFSRFGDGEWTAILQTRPGKGNCDNHRYFPDMGKALHDVLADSPDYYIGLQSMAKRMYPEQIERYTNDFKLVWCEANIIHRENIKRRLETLYSALKHRDVLLVGPQHLHKLAIREKWYFVEIPTINCWLEVDQIRQNINALISHKDWVIIYCASMMANVLIHDFRGKVTQIDVGSALDPDVNVKSRRYHFDL